MENGCFDPFCGKVLGEDSFLIDFSSVHYYDFKKRNGYSELETPRKT